MKNLDSRSQQNSITDTQILVISLAKSLSDLTVQDYILYLDNLFINISLADALGKSDGLLLYKTLIQAQNSLKIHDGLELSL